MLRKSSQSDNNSSAIEANKLNQLASSSTLFPPRYTLMRTYICT